MAKSPEEQNIKSKARRRLIGAVALSLAVVVILPMVLDSEPRVTGKDIDLRIPEPEKVGEFAPGAAVSEVTEASIQAEAVAGQASAVVADESVQKAVATGKVTQPEVAAPEVKPAEAAEPVTVKPMPAKPAEAKARQVVAASIDTKKPDTRKTDTQKSDTQKSARQAENQTPQKTNVTYIVQVGAFSNRDTATQEAGKLKALGFKAYTELVSGTTRVRVGPYSERGKADEVRLLLEKHGLHPVITAVK